MNDSIACFPKVFRIPQGACDPALVALMMPFDKAFDATCEAVKGVAESLCLQCKRVDDFWRASELIQDVFELIYRSAFVVCDFSGRNPNVFYEAGIAHTLGRDVIPIVQNEEDIPFDLRQHRFIKYLPNTQGLQTLADQLKKRMIGLVESARESKTSVGHDNANIPLQDTNPGLSTVPPGDSSSRPVWDTSQHKPWRPPNW